MTMPTQDPSTLSPDQEAAEILAATIDSYASPRHEDMLREWKSLTVEAALHRTEVSTLQRRLAQAEARQESMEARIREIQPQAAAWEGEVDRLRTMILDAIEGCGHRYIPSDGARPGRVLDQHGNDVRPDWRFRA